MWVCEFCSTENEIDIMVPDEVPLKEEVLYMVTLGASAGSSSAMGGGQAGKDALVVFCIDTSGSMGTTTEVRNTNFSFHSNPFTYHYNFLPCRYLEDFN